jgi:hypothetical protein
MEERAPSSWAPAFAFPPRQEPDGSVSNQEDRLAADYDCQANLDQPGWREPVREDPQDADGTEPYD